MTDAFFSFLPDPADLIPVLFLGDPLDFRDEGDPLELAGSGEIFVRLLVLFLPAGSSFLITISSLFPCSLAPASLARAELFRLFISRDSS
uniref:Uncharacterized protein n=1 Tax=Anguilla anguilla TaxID=7936 RepID=A0A0E9QF13_ANGAN